MVIIKTVSVFSTLLDDMEQYQRIVSCINSGVLPLSVTGVAESALAHLIFCVRERIDKNTLVILPDEMSAAKMKRDLEFFCGDNVYLYPQREYLFYDIDASSADILTNRFKVLQALGNGGRNVIITSVGALMQSACPAEEYKARSMTFCIGESYDLEKLVGSFIELGYTREKMVEGGGQFSLRGGILDFFPLGAESPYRVEFFDNEVESIKTFDALSQRSSEKVQTATVTACSEIILSEQMRRELIDDLCKAAEGAKGDTLKYLERDVEKLENYSYFPSLDKYIPTLYKKLPTFMDYFDDAAVFLCESSQIHNSARNFNENINDTVAQMMEKNVILPQKGEYVLEYEQLALKLADLSLIEVSSISNNAGYYKSKEIITIPSKAHTAVSGNVEMFCNSVKYFKDKKYKTIILSDTVQKSKNIARVLDERGIYASHEPELPETISEGQVISTAGYIAAGFEYPSVKLAVISDNEFFVARKKKRALRDKTAGERIKSYTDLAVGDYVVHQGHGIGQFVGMKTLTVDGASADYLQIKYNGTDKLYIPANQLDLIYKYTGKEGTNVRLSKLGGADWLRTKQRVKKACADMAEQLINLYALRQNVQGIAFSKDKEWQKQFEDAFVYEETEDQLRCIDEVKRDMEGSRPMDRLLCGDVGYGKTEVALRAAFKAVMSGYQVAYLVPTTILASQHYNTFVDRMKDFPVKVEMLSRFRTPKQLAQTVENIRSGEVDIVIGTHRLLQKDINFAKLGLLIIDEEQRFGVAHKERIKEFKASVDVLTLTATPIPRTLHMSIIGVRDMSVIENPPLDRYPVSTYVLEYDEDVVREAIIKEISRGGQVYYLHNNIATIYKAAERIQRAIPDLRIGVAHGRMNEGELERVMMQVLVGEVDLLMCTTIVETGLDIPNINTIIIENSDRMGLAQLYQLRGRVGRSNRLAYAYLTYKRDKVLSEVSEKRLRAVREFTEFGAGFKIALRDLEIRGAGNVVGAQQHGHMDAVGYDLYCKLLAEAVAEGRGEALPPQVQAVVNFAVDAYIPKKYISGENYRIEMYKKIASIQNEEDYNDVREEIGDRYGTIVPEVVNLLDISLLKATAESLGFCEVTQKGNNVVFVFNENSFDMGFVTEIIAADIENLWFSPAAKPYITYKILDKREVLTDIKFLLQRFLCLQKTKK